MDGGTLRYDHQPVLQSVFAYGSETQVPDHDVCRLSYYVKCCVVGCGIQMPLADDALLDYMSAHTLPSHLQDLIKRMAFHELSLEKVLNSALIIDEQHILLPYGTLNTFYEFKTASTYFTINSISIGSGRQECVHKVMLCTFKWLQEYYINPFFREQQSNPILAALLNPALSRELQPAIDLLAAQLTVAAATAGSQQQQQARPDQQRSSQEEQQRWQQQDQQSQCQQQITQRIRPPEATQVQALTERDAIIPDVPVAIAVPVDDDSIDMNLVEAPAAVVL
jgi:hypothetical protein